MPVYQLHRTQILPLPLEECWNFFADPRNLSKITPPSLRFRVRSELPEKIYPGLLIEYRVSPVLGFPLSWLTEIVHVDEPRHFVDEQRVGPYRLWHHEHFFRAVSERETEVCDLVHYVPPLGPLGALLNPIMIRPQLQRIFAFRETTLREWAWPGRPDRFT